MVWIINYNFCLIYYYHYFISIILYLAPPPGLEGDDLEYFNDLEERKSKVKDIRAVNEGKAVDAFRMAQKKKDYASLKPKASLENPIGISKSIFTQNKDIPDNLPVFKRKSINETNKLISKKTKVIENSDNNNMKNDNIDTNIHNNIHNDSESKFIIPTESKPESKVLSGMFDYNSDSD